MENNYSFGVIEDLEEIGVEDFTRCPTLAGVKEWSDHVALHRPRAEE